MLKKITPALTGLAALVALNSPANAEITSLSYQEPIGVIYSTRINHPNSTDKISEGLMTLMENSNGVPLVAMAAHSCYGKPGEPVNDRRRGCNPRGFNRILFRGDERVLTVSALDTRKNRSNGDALIVRFPEKLERGDTEPYRLATQAAEVGDVVFMRIDPEIDQSYGLVIARPFLEDRYDNLYLAPVRIGSRVAAATNCVISDENDRRRGRTEQTMCLDPPRWCNEYTNPQQPNSACTTRRHLKTEGNPSKPYGIFQIGNSGGPLFNPEGYIVGTLSGQVRNDQGVFGVVTLYTQQQLNQVNRIE